jgi:hypothetical protein
MTKAISLASLQQVGTMLQQRAVDAAGGKDRLRLRDIAAEGQGEPNGPQVRTALSVLRTWAARKTGDKTPTVAAVQARVGDALAAFARFDRDGNGSIDPGAEQTGASQLASFRAFAALADRLGSGATVDLSATQAAIAAAGIPEISDNGRNFALSSYPEGTTLDQMLSDITSAQVEDAEAPDSGFTFVQGTTQATQGFASDIEAEGQALLEGADTPAEGQREQQLFQTVATAAAKDFSSAGFDKVTLVRHPTADDGDPQYNILLGHKVEGGWQALGYTNIQV